MAQDLDLLKLSSPRIFLVRMLVFLILCTLLVFVLHKQIWVAFLAAITGAAPSKRRIVPPRLPDRTSGFMLASPPGACQPRRKECAGWCLPATGSSS